MRVMNSGSKKTPHRLGMELPPRKKNPWLLPDKERNAEKDKYDLQQRKRYTIRMTKKHFVSFAPFSRLLPDKERTETNATWFGSILCCKTAKTSDTRIRMTKKHFVSSCGDIVCSSCGDIVCSYALRLLQNPPGARPVDHSQRHSIGAPPLDRPVAHSPAPPLDRSATTRSAPPLDRRAEDRADCGLGKHPARPRGERAESASRGRQVGVVGGMIPCMGGGCHRVRIHV